MKNTEKYYDIHGLVKIKISTNSESIQTEAIAHLREFTTSKIDDDQLDIIILDYSQRISLESPVIISDYYYYANNWLHVPSKSLCFNLVNKQIVLYSDRFNLPINILVEIILLRQGYTLIHSAGFSYNGKSYLVPTFGGVGKTTTLAKVVENGGKYTAMI
jgi:hypothetical protein